MDGPAMVHHVVVAQRMGHGAVDLRRGPGAGGIHPAFLQPSNGKPAAINRSIDAWSTWHQHVFLALRQDNARILIDGPGLMSGLSYTLAIKAPVAAKRQLLTDLNRRAVAARRWGLEHVDEYAAIWSRETGVPPDVSTLTLQARVDPPSFPWLFPALGSFALWVDCDGVGLMFGTSAAGAHSLWHEQASSHARLPRRGDHVGRP